MQEITKEQYIERINDYERLYLVTTDDQNIYLKSDIECGGEIGLRIELMDFKLDTSLTFWNACNECRCRYTGGICFIDMILMKKPNKMSLLIFSIYLLTPFTYSAKIPKYKRQQIIIQTKTFIF